MDIELLRSAHCVGESSLHLILTPAYRRAIFEDVATRTFVRDYALAQADRKGFIISAIGFGTDHVHLFIVQWKNHSIARLAQLLKGFTSRMMRQHHASFFRNKLWGTKFWSGGYFYRTVGAVNAATVKRYVAESQEYGVSRSELSEEKAQRKLLEFMPN